VGAGDHAGCVVNVESDIGFFEDDVLNGAYECAVSLDGIPSSICRYFGYFWPGFLWCSGG
jgi:hypothetical protein